METFFYELKPYFAEDSLWSWIGSGVTAVLATVLIKMILKIISRFFRKRAEKTFSLWDNAGADLLEGFKASVVFVGTFYLLTRHLTQTSWVESLLLTISVTSLVLQVGIWGLYIIKFWRKRVLDKKIELDQSSAAALGLLYTAVQVGFLVVLFLVGLSNLGVDITALLAGLGVGGIAVALAAQNILGDLLASLSIVLDKPFVVGDFIVSGEEKGTVEHIGIKTTRLRSLSGEQVILANKDLLESRVKNYKRMWIRRVVQSFGVTYSTSAETLEKIPLWVKEIVQAESQLKFDRCHFMTYGNSSLDFELVFFVSDPDYNIFMDLQQRVLLNILKKFVKEDVSFAFPTQTLYVEALPQATTVR
ncbi:MAG: mechanosensitive ion channel family protein [Bdellovibrionales bacterium]